MKQLIKRVLKAINNSVIFSQKKRAFFLQHNENNYNLSPATIRKAHRMGFSADEYVIYGLDKNPASDYISEFERSLYRDSMLEYRQILDNKILFYSIIRNFADVNTIYAYRLHNGYVALEEGFELEDIPAKIRELGKIVYKINFAGGGKGLHMLEYDGNDYLINRKKASLKEIQELLSTGDYFLEEFCVQSDFEEKLFPYSVNTMRLVTTEDRNGNIDVPLGVKRIGMNPEFCVDNGYAGGVLSKIDVATGTIHAARPFAHGSFFQEDGSAFEFKVHPITGAQIEGLIIPNWDALKADLCELHRKVRFMDIPSISWDIALIKDGYKIIEANISTSMEIQYLYGGLRNKPYGRWMKERGYIK